MFADKPYIDTIPINRETVPQEILDRYAAQPVPDAAEYFAIMEQAVAMNSADSPTRVILGVDGPQRCSDELIEMTGDFQRRHHCGLHTHMLETKTQAVMADRKGPGFVRRMLEAGIIDEKSSLVHFIWADDDDIAAAREGGVTVIHCPASNLMLGAGLSPVLILREAGIPVAFGTDGSNCGPPSLFETMRMGCYLMRLTDPDFEKWPDAPEVLRSAYRSGSRAMGWNEKTGVLKNGARADVVSLDQGGHWHSPMGDLKRHLLHYENGSSVSDVWVDGMQVVKNKEITALDLDGLLSEAQDIVLRRRDMVPAKAMEAIESQYPAFRNMILETLKDGFGIERRVTLN
jgi:cytosine/adenosine deaminase-related metal-dependent hydrolase